MISSTQCKMGTFCMSYDNFSLEEVLEGFIKQNTYNFAYSTDRFSGFY